MNKYIQPKKELILIHDCKHINKSYKKKERIDGNYMLVLQCDDCFEQIGGQQKKILVEDVYELPTFNEEFQIKHRELQYEFNRQQREKGQLENQIIYREYLKTDKWKIKRLKVLERDNYLCQACLSNKATDVHHLSYRFKFNEPLFDLISVCRNCHDKITKLELERIY